MKFLNKLVKRIKTIWFEWQLKRTYTSDTYVYEEDEIFDDEFDEEFEDEFDDIEDFEGHDID